jgi:hypothetical protein
VEKKHLQECEYWLNVAKSYRKIYLVSM